MGSIEILLAKSKVSKCQDVQPFQCEVKHNVYLDSMKQH